jgi:hypothetical protein
MARLGDEPVLRALDERVRRLPGRRRSLGAYEHEADLGLVEAQLADGVVELAERAQEPPIAARRGGLGVRARTGVRRDEVELGHALRAIEPQLDVAVAQRVALSANSIASSATPVAARAWTLAASSRAIAPTDSFHLESGAIASTRFHSTARLPLMPSATVEKRSQRSRRTLRLSVMRVRPPVPGSTPSSGTSGNETALLRSSTSRILSHASASS